MLLERLILVLWDTLHYRNSVRICAQDSRMESVSVMKKDNAENNIETENGKEEVNIAKEIWGWVRIVIIALAAAVIINNFVIINANIPSESMESTIMIGDRVIGFRFAYMLSEPERGDIIIFKWPKDETETYIKRIIGCPGETVIVDTDGSVSIKLTTGTVIKLDETYINEEMRVYERSEYVVGENEYFVMGDNRNSSSDSRSWGTVDRDEIIAKAIFRYWPVSQMGIVK